MPEQVDQIVDVRSPRQSRHVVQTTGGGHLPTVGVEEGEVDDLAIAALGAQLDRVVEQRPIIGVGPEDGKPEEVGIGVEGQGTSADAHASTHREEGTDVGRGATHRRMDREVAGFDHRQDRRRPPLVVTRRRERLVGALPHE